MPEHVDSQDSVRQQLETLIRKQNIALIKQVYLKKLIYREDTSVVVDVFLENLEALFFGAFSNNQLGSLAELIKIISREYSDDSYIIKCAIEDAISQKNVAMLDFVLEQCVKRDEYKDFITFAFTNNDIYRHFGTFKYLYKKIFEKNFSRVSITWNPDAIIKASDVDKDAQSNYDLFSFLAVAEPSLEEVRDYWGFILAVQKQDIDYLSTLAPSFIQTMVKEKDYHALQEAAKHTDDIILNRLLSYLPVGYDFVPIVESVLKCHRSIECVIEGVEVPFSAYENKLLQLSLDRLSKEDYLAIVTAHDRDPIYTAESGAGYLLATACREQGDFTLLRFLLSKINPDDKRATVIKDVQAFAECYLEPIGLSIPCDLTTQVELLVKEREAGLYSDSALGLQVQGVRSESKPGLLKTDGIFLTDIKLDQLFSLEQSMVDSSTEGEKIGLYCLGL